MASTAELCKIITNLGGNPEALSDKTAKTLTEKIISLLSSYGNTTIKATLDSLSTAMTAQQSRVPTSAEVVSAIDTMTADQISAVKTKLGIS